MISPFCFFLNYVPRSEGRKSESGCLKHLFPFPQTAYRCRHYLQYGHITIRTFIERNLSLRYFIQSRFNIRRVTPPSRDIIIQLGDRDTWNNKTAFQ